LLLIGLGLLSGCKKESNPFEEKTAEKPISSQNNRDTIPSDEIINIPESFKEKSPVEKKLVGAQIRVTPQEENSKSKKEKGVWDIKLLLDDQKVNRLNQRRDPELIEKSPELFGVEGEFKPLMIMEAKGPGIIKIRGKLVGNIEIEIGTGIQTVEVYPNYQLEELFGDKPSEIDTLYVIFADDSKETLVEKIETRWSSTDEVYMLDSNLNDLVTIVEEKKQATKKEFSDIKVWLKAAALGLEKLKIKEESLTENTTWQRVRNSEEIRGEKLANCIDLTVWLARKGAENGFQTYIITLPKHVLLGISNSEYGKKGETLDTLIYVDTPYLLEEYYKQEGAFEAEKDQLSIRVDKAITTGTNLVNSQFKKEPDKMFALELKEWENMYRNKP
jgi:hypothetical protein